MGSAVFVLRYNLESGAFAQSFLASPDFDLDSLKEISRHFGVRASSSSKSDLVTLIIRQINNQFTDRSLQKINEQLVGRTKEWISVKSGRVTRIPKLPSVSDLVLGQGSEEWYGPVVLTNSEPLVNWYIRPVFVEYWDMAENGKPEKYLARWLCFARVSLDAISLHWRGFTYPTGPDAVSVGSRKLQFPYWSYIPELFREIEELTQANVEYINLHELTLHSLWDKYQDDTQFKWTHRRIRAESNGVSLSAHAGAVDEINVGGILHLARTVRNAVDKELRDNFDYGLPDPVHFDNTILRTLIREYGALSYEFSLEQGKELLFSRPQLFWPETPFTFFGQFSSSTNICIKKRGTGTT